MSQGTQLVCPEWDTSVDVASLAPAVTTLAEQYQQVSSPVGDSLFLSSLFAMLPLLVLFVLLGFSGVSTGISGVSEVFPVIRHAVAVIGKELAPAGFPFAAPIGSLNR